MSEVLFVHQDLGIGGAEKLVLSLVEGYRLVCPRSAITIATCRFDPSRAFPICASYVYEGQPKSLGHPPTEHPPIEHPPTGHPPTEHPPTDPRGSVTILAFGQGIPQAVAGRFVAVVSILRLVFVILCLFWHRKGRKFDLVFSDQLALLNPLLRKLLARRLIFYCHFPEPLLGLQNAANAAKLEDLLTEKNSNGEAAGAFVKSSEEGGAEAVYAVKCVGAYRACVNRLERWGLFWEGSEVWVNSAFTKRACLTTFGKALAPRISILEPCLDDGTFDQKEKVDVPTAEKADAVEDLVEATEVEKEELEIRQFVTDLEGRCFVSLNRFERRKNFLVILQAFFRAIDRPSARKETPLLTHVTHEVGLILCGGFDQRCHENIVCVAELKQHLAARKKANAACHVRLLLNPSESMKKFLFSECAACLYGPRFEHFGIIPIEAMSAGCPVVAHNSGGPSLTIRPGKTGFLVRSLTHVQSPHEQTPPTPHTHTSTEDRTGLFPDFESALLHFLDRGADYVGIRREMEKACRERAQDFSFAKFVEKMTALLEKKIL